MKFRQDGGGSGRGMSMIQGHPIGGPEASLKNGAHLVAPDIMAGDIVRRSGEWDRRSGAKRHSVRALMGQPTWTNAQRIVMRRKSVYLRPVLLRVNGLSGALYAP